MTADNQSLHTETHNLSLCFHRNDELIALIWNIYQRQLKNKIQFFVIDSKLLSRTISKQNHTLNLWHYWSRKNNLVSFWMPCCLFSAELSALSSFVSICTSSGWWFILKQSCFRNEVQRTGSSYVKTTFFQFWKWHCSLGQHFFSSVL